MHNHNAEVLNASKNNINDESIRRMAKLYKNFSDNTRLRILVLLAKGELCVNAISEILDVSQSATSHQLRILKDNRLIGFRKEGKECFYFLLDDHVEKIINQGYEHVQEE